MMNGGAIGTAKGKERGAREKKAKAKGRKEKKTMS